MALGLGLGYGAAGASQGLLDLWKIRLLEQEAEARAQAEKNAQMMREKELGLRQQEMQRSGDLFKLQQQEMERKAALENFALTDQMPEAQLPHDYKTAGIDTGLAPSLTLPQAPSGQLATPPGMPNAPTIPVTGGHVPFVQGASLPGYGRSLETPSPTDIGSAPIRAIRPMTIPGVGSVGPMQATPRSAEAIQQAKQKEEFDKAMYQWVQTPEGGTSTLPGAGLKIQGVPKPETVQGENWVDSHGNPVFRQGFKFIYANTGQPVPETERVRKAPPEQNPLAQAIMQERLDKMRQDALPYDIDPEIRTTSLGNRYLEINSSHSQSERTKMREAANQAGVTVVTSPTLAAKLVDVETARANQSDIMDDIEKSLPKDAQGRILAAPGITLDRILQIGDARAAYGAWRTAAIGTLKAMVGGQGSGLRINQAEIILALQNDIPELTDTLDVARHKFKNIEKQLNNVEYAILNKFPPRAGQQQQTAPPPVGTPVLGGKYNVVVPGKK